MRIVGNPAVRRSASRVAVVLEGSGCGVELAAVEFDDEFLFSVDGVDFVAGQLGGGDEALDLGLVDGSGELLGGQDVGEVDERPGGGGDADAVVGGRLGVGGAVDVDAGMAALGRRGHLCRCVPAREDPPQRAGRAVTQRRVGTAGQHRRDRRGQR